MMDAAIEKIWFEEGRIWMRTAQGREYSQPLEAFPTLKDATEQERQDYYLWDSNQSIRWEKIDEDIHISNFLEPLTANYDNEVNRLLSRFPWLDLREFAAILGMHKSKLDRFRYGIWTPSRETFEKIRAAIVRLGREMSAAVL